MDAVIPSPNSAIAALLLSARMRSMVTERGEVALAAYRGIVAKRTGRLADSAQVDVFVGGRKSDRWCSRLTIGGTEAPYGALHEEDAHDLNRVLNLLGTL